MAALTFPARGSGSRAKRETPVTALIVAAGAGSRLPGGVPKGLRLLGGVPLFLHSLAAFDRVDAVDSHLLVVPRGRLEEASSVLTGRVMKRVRVIEGGPHRQDSVRLGLEAIAESAPSRPGPGRLVAVHDAARPFPAADLIERTIAAARAGGAALPALAVTDTVRELAVDGGQARVLDRSRLRLAQTPQVGRLDWLLEAYHLADKTGSEVTDEGSALEAAGFGFAFVAGSPSNFKITTPDELETAEVILAAQHGPPRMRIGFGEDRHPRAENRRFVLAGVTLAAQGGPSGHSDGDPLCHALVDALLGAAGEGTIGEHFPDTDPRWAGAAGLDLLRAAVQLISEAGYGVVNVDAVVIADSPRLSPHAAEIARRLAEVLGVDPKAVSVKGKRAEGLGFEGREDGVSCRAVALLEARFS